MKHYVKLIDESLDCMEILETRMLVKMHFYDPILIIFQTIVMILAKNRENADISTMDDQQSP